MTHNFVYIVKFFILLDMSSNEVDETSGLYPNLVDSGNSDSYTRWNSSLNTRVPFTQNGYSLRPLICRPHRLWHRVMLGRFTRKVSCRFMALSIFLLVTIVILYFGIYSESSVEIFNSLTKQQPPASVFHCGNTAAFLPHDHTPPDNVSSLEGLLREEPKVLLLTETQYSRHGRTIAELLVANQIKYKLEVLRKSLPLLTDLSRGKYGAIIFENIERYLAMDQWNRELLDKYLLQYRVGIVGFFPMHSPAKTYAKLHNFPLYITSSTSLMNVSLNGDNPVLRLTRAGDSLPGILGGGYNWSLFIPNHPTYIPLEWAYDASHLRKDKMILTILDTGKFDGIQRVIFGGGLHFWLHRLLLLDALSYLSHGRLSVSLERYIIVDIDDVFVGPKGNRMTPSDIKALIEAQERLQQLIPDFRFNLGFSGKFFKSGTYIENEGDEILLKHVDKFWWFGHMWRHTQPHKIETADKLMAQMAKNKEFAIEHGIPTDSGYSVAPHHSGVYPVHEPLYQAWKSVWNIRVTSTEEYPHLRPARLRRGFIHRNIMVLPRQTCGLYTHTSFLSKYPGGRKVLEKSIHGGELFQTIVSNPINIFMTHQNNYANDRLALFTFETVIKFLQCWTNLKLFTAHPLQLGEKYFHLFPHETDPIWGNPCLDHRHLDIWSPNKTCSQLPRFLVIGPQKTGTTALYTFLSIHPAIMANNPSPETYEEIQFFNGKNYYKGIDWYMKFFPSSSNSSAMYLFEKSATYFDGEVVPKRVQALLPNAQLVTIIIPPEKRAYSWYHHMRAHNDPTSLAYTFYQVITATPESPRPLRDLRNKCLNPSMYAKNLERWLSFFPASQISIIDGEELRNDPVAVMNNLQKFLNIQPFFNYTEHLRFNKRKGFFCQVIEEDRTKCLGRGKGRRYPPMEEGEMKLLQEFYRSHNIALEKLLVRLNYRVPSWLYQQLQGT